MRLEARCATQRATVVPYVLSALLPPQGSRSTHALVQKLVTRPAGVRRMGRSDLARSPVGERSMRLCDSSMRQRGYGWRVRVYAIADLDLRDRHGLGQTIGDLHLSRRDAETWLAEVLADQPEWGERLRVVRVDLGRQPLTISPQLGAQLGSCPGMCPGLRLNAVLQDAPVPGAIGRGPRGPRRCRACGPAAPHPA
jgi:hypothetical protein